MNIYACVRQNTHHFFLLHFGCCCYFAFFSSSSSSSFFHVVRNVGKHVQCFQISVNISMMRCCLFLHSCFFSLIFQWILKMLPHFIYRFNNSLNFRIFHKNSVTKKIYPSICNCQYSESTIISSFSRSVNVFISFHSQNRDETSARVFFFFLSFIFSFYGWFFILGMFIHDITKYFEITHIYNINILISEFVFWFVFDLTTSDSFFILMRDKESHSDTFFFVSVSHLNVEAIYFAISNVQLRTTWFVLVLFCLWSILSNFQ